MSTTTANTIGPAPAIPRVLPVPDDLTAPFWSSTERAVLSIQQCQRCSTFQHPPRRLCQECGWGECAFVPTSGRGRLASWTVTHHPVLAALKPHLPYVCLLVELDEQQGLYVISDLLGRDVDVADLRCGMPLRVVFEALGEFNLPQFVPTEEDD